MKKMITVCVEVILKKSASSADSKYTSVCSRFLLTSNFRPGTIISNFDKAEYPFLYENVDHIIIGENSKIGNPFIDFTQVKIKWYLYTLDKSGQVDETDCHDDENIQLATVRILPSADYFNLWENLVYDNNIKESLLKYAETAMLFADRGVNTNIVNCNRVVLLHGPPGTGKTSLCKALAHKLTIHLNDHFKRGLLMEINSHSLFSKWFSESGKLVTKMFTKISEFLTDRNSIVFILIDEIESLSHARNKCLSGAEPSDSIRVVNALLTQLDQIKNNPNVFILTTSNMTGAIDVAFVDRIDIKQYIGLPGTNAIYQIYCSCIEELMQAEIIFPKVIISPIQKYINSEYIEHRGTTLEHSNRLYKISKLSTGLSGRTLRKIPFLTHSLFLEDNVVDIITFLDAMTKAIKQFHNEEKYFAK